MASIKYLQSDVWAENQYFTSVKFFGPKQVTSQPRLKEWKNRLQVLKGITEKNYGNF